MARLLFLFIVTSTIMCKAFGGNLLIKAKFMFGDVLFIWNGTSPEGYNVSIPTDTTHRQWIHVNDSRCTVQNALKYDSISISVYLLKGQKYGDGTYKVDIVQSQRGITQKLSWVTPFFPSAGTYTIYHTNVVNKTIIQVTSTDVKEFPKEKYKYISHPYNSKDIAFEISNITLEDAGYYAGGVTSEAAWLEGGRILIIKEKPLKPKIAGNLTILENSHIELFCSSKQISAPEYNAKLTPLYYMWSVNGSQPQKSNQTLRFRVTRNDRYNRYSCVAADTLQSDRSDEVQINVLYGPDKVVINPSPKLNQNNDITVREGDEIGPYSCSADCNPPCNVTWKYVDTDGKWHDVTSSHTTTMLQKIVNRKISQFSCVGEYNSSVKEMRNFSLDVQYLDEPIAYINGRQVSDNSTEKVSVQENTSLYLSCYGNGKPNPTIYLSRSGNVGMNIVPEINEQKWRNHTIQHVQCADTDTYRCVCESAGFNKVKTFGVSILCKPRLDESYPIATNYLSESGPKVIVIVQVPLISNPAPGESNITWSGPAETQSIKSTVRENGVPYRHRIRGSIPILDQSYFGNYTMKCNGEEIITINVSVNEQVSGGQSSRSRANSTVIALTSSIVAAVVILIFTVLVAWHFLKRKKVEVKRKSLMLEGMIGPEETNEPTEVYAVVHKSPLNLQRNKKDARIDDSNKDDDNELYENTTKESAMITKQRGKMKKQKHKSSSAGPTSRESASGSENQDGLLYVDMDFGEQSENLETNGKPKIHGDEDKTEYTFVDFSKKAPPAQENQESEVAKD